MSLENSFVRNSTDLFEGHRGWDTIQAIHLIFHIIFTFIAPILNYAVVWYQNIDGSQHRNHLTNQLLTHVCIISIIRSFTVRIASVLWLHFGPFSSRVCDVALLAGRFFFLLVLAELTLWQFIKYLNSFWPKHILSINDHFMSNFLTFLNICINLVLIVVAYMKGLQNSEVDYHICTGNEPQKNINITINAYNDYKGSTIPFITFRNVRNLDYIHFATPTACLLLLLFATQVWAKSIKERCSNKISDENSGQQISKKALYGAGQSLVVIGIMMLLLAPSQISLNIFNEDPKLANMGPGKIWTYVSRITMSLFSYCGVPIIILINNPNLRQTLSNKIKAHFQYIN
jgi:hypothetical protein